MADEGNKRVAASWRQFFVLETRKTNGAHLDLVKKIKGIGHIEVYDPEECDYLLVICPAVSQVGTYISEATESLPAGKPAILVVMHHTFNDFKVVVADSRRQVNNPNVYVTVDVLFYEKKLLDCDRNRIAWGEIQSFLVIPRVQVPRISWWNRVRSSDWIRIKCIWVFVGAVLVAIMIILLTIVIHMA